MEAEESFELFESSQANKQNMTANTFSYAGTVVNGTKQSNDGNKSNHRVPKSGNYPTGHPKNGGQQSNGNGGQQKTRPPPKKRTALVVNQDKNGVEEIEVKGGHQNQRWKNVPDQVKQNWIKRNESQTRREVIFHGIPSSKT